MRNRNFWHSLHDRGESSTSLAEKICSSRSHISQVINGRRSGLPTRRKLIAKGLLTAKEIELLGWEVPHGALSHVERDSEAAPAEPRIERKAFHVGDYAVSLVPSPHGFTFEIYHATRGIVAAGDGFSCIGLAESAARTKASALVVEGLLA